MSTIPLPPTLPAFAAQVGTRFALGDVAGVSLQLFEAVPLNGASPHEGAFSLMFRGPADAPLQQATHVLDHAALGRLAIFLVPVGRDSAGMQYQAIFN